MGLRSGVSQYRQVSNQEAVSGASPHRLIQMMMEGALTRMLEAKGAVQRRDIAAKGVAIGKAVSLVGGLQDSLDMDAPGGLSQELDSLYSYITDCLLRANLENSEPLIDEAARLLATVKSGWDAIADQVS
jgi:flagellar protein FliS